MVSYGFLKMWSQINDEEDKDKCGEYSLKDGEDKDKGGETEGAKIKRRVES